MPFHNSSFLITKTVLKRGWKFFVITGQASARYLCKLYLRYSLDNTLAIIFFRTLVRTRAIFIKGEAFNAYQRAVYLAEWLPNREETFHFFKKR